MFQKRHYEYIARYIRSSSPSPEIRVKLANVLSEAFYRDNSYFNVGKFYIACGIFFVMPEDKKQTEMNDPTRIYRDAGVTYYVVE